MSRPLTSSKTLLCLMCFMCFFVASLPARAQDDEVTAQTTLGIAADRAGNLKEAERHFAAAVKADPNSASARNNYGAILMRTGRSSTSPKFAFIG